MSEPTKIDKFCIIVKTKLCYTWIITHNDMGDDRDATFIFNVIKSSFPKHDDVMLMLSKSKDYVTLNEDQSLAEIKTKLKNKIPLVMVFENSLWKQI